MSLLATHLGGRATWTDDRGLPTPACFDLPDREYMALTHEAGLVDFTHGGVIALSGPENVSFLASLLTNQMKHVTSSRAIYAALLTPQGRFSWDFTVLERKNRIMLVTEPDRIPALMQRLQMYVLRTKVELDNASARFGTIGIVGPKSEEVILRALPDFKKVPGELGAVRSYERPVRSGSDKDVKEKLWLWRDPRHAAFGWRLLVNAAQLPSVWDRLTDAGATLTGLAAWEHYRIAHGLPRGGSEFIPDVSLPLESGLLEMHGVDFSKGCYIGQETTTRTHRRDTLKRRLYVVELSGDESTVMAGAPICLPGGKEVGVLTSMSRLQSQCLGLALLKTEEIRHEERLICGATSVTRRAPEWASWKE
jgi:folate-binding protein YgfZ